MSTGVQMPSFFARQAGLVLVSSLAVTAVPARALAGDLLVFAAASLATALDQVAAVWSEKTGHKAVMSYAGSSALARQIQEGAPADIFISASTDWMDAVETSGDLQSGTRRDILGNRLVLIGHGRDAVPVTLDENLDLVGLLEGGRLSMALVEAVPAGIYGRQALRTLGLWEEVAPWVAQSDNVRMALGFVAQGEAPLGIVYATDAAADDNVIIVGVFPENSHAPITYPAALTAQSESAVAGAFLEFLSSEPARTIWQEFGFRVID